MKYTFVFDYTGASQEFKTFDILNRGHNLRGKGSTKDDEVESSFAIPKTIKPIIQ